MNKVIVITGASYGLGEELSKHFIGLKEYNVASISRSAKPSESDHQIEFRGDITKGADIDSFLELVKKKWGLIDILVNNAGIVGEFKPIQDYTEEEIDKILNVNVKGTFMITQRSLSRMRRPGYIINIGSTRSITGAPDKTLYSMSKFALRGLTQSLNSEMKKQGIYSTIICPGSFSTVPLSSIAKTVENLINLPFSAHVPEIIIGGML